MGVAFNGGALGKCHRASSEQQHGVLREAETTARNPGHNRFLSVKGALCPFEERINIHVLKNTEKRVPNSKEGVIFIVVSQMFAFSLI